MNLLQEPLLTSELDPDSLQCAPGARYLYARGPEERSDLDDAWMLRQPSVRFVEVLERSVDEIEIEGQAVRLRDRTALELAVQWPEVQYIDITGMTYTTWAPLIAALVTSSQACKVIYREPKDYTRSATPTRGMIYDLSETVAGIAPLPGMASIRVRRGAASVCVPLLGFEGARLAHVLASTEPDAGRVVPIVGAPGFRPEYTAQALLANRLILEQDNHYSRIQFAKANCPFDLFHQLVKVREQFASPFLRVAPVGTKPHGLGAVLFALGRPNQAEIVYDHPKRKRRRTTGHSRLCLYEISEFVQSDLFRGSGPHA